MAFTDHVKVKLGMDSKGFNNGLASAETRAQKFKKIMGSRLAGGLGAAAFIAATKKTIDFGAAIGDLSDRLGVSAEFLQTMQFAAEQNGSSTEEASKAMEKLSKSIGEAEIGSKLYVDAFKKLGVELRNADGSLKSTEKITMEVADGLQGIEDPAIRVHTAFALMGRSGTAMTQFMKDGAGKIEEFGDQARDMGMIVGNDNVKALQDASGELEKAGRGFSVLAAEILPGLIKVLQNAKLGWDLIVLAFKSFPTTAELVGKAILNNIVDNFKLLVKEAALVGAKLNAFKIEFNPFASEADIEKRKKQLLAAQADVEKARKNADLNLQQRQKQILSGDKELAADAKKVAKEKNALQEKFNQINDKGLKTKVRVTEQTQKEKAAIAEINGERTKEEITLGRTLDKIKALKAGGEDALKVVEERHEMEDKIQGLMERGEMTREQATKLARDLIAAENEELQLHEQIKEEQKKKVDLKEQEADRKEIAEGLREEAKLHQEARQEMANGLEVMRLRANGQDEEADILEQNLENKKEVANIMDEMGVTEQAAIDLLNKKLGLEEKITNEKINQGIEEIKNGNLKAGEDLNNLGATDRGKALREMDKEERKRAKDQARADRLQKILADPDKNMTDQEKAKIQKNLDKLKDDLLTDEQRKQIKQLEDQRKKAKDLAAAQKKELDKRQKEIKDLADKKEQDLKALEAKAKKALEEAGANIKKKMADAFNAGEKAIKNAGDAIVNALNRFNWNAQGGNPGAPTPNGGGGSSTTPIVEVAAPDLTSLQSTLTQNATALGDKIANQIAQIALPNTQPGGGVTPPQPVSSTINLDIDTESLANDSTMQSILEALRGKFKNE
tara:strand:+ start:29 stop:2569 length:2541 start_codon:yes stop_codon:yes gene_type:complete